MKNSWNDPFPNCKNCGGPFNPGTCAYCGTYTDDRVELKVTYDSKLLPEIEMLMEDILLKSRIYDMNSNYLLDLSL